MHLKIKGFQLYNLYKKAEQKMPRKTESNDLAKGLKLKII